MFWFSETAPTLGASDASLNRIVAQIDSMFPPVGGVVVAIDKQTLTLDLKKGQSIKPGDRLNLIRFGADIIHPTSKKKIGRQETDLGKVKIIEVRRDYSLAKLMDSTVQIRVGDGVRSPFNKLTFLVASPAIETTQKIDKDRLRLELEKKLADHPRFQIPAFELDLWLLENNLNTQSLFNQNNLDKLNRRVKTDYLLVSSVRSVKQKLVLSYKLYSAQTGQLQKQAKILSDRLPVERLERRPAPREQDIQRSFSRPEDALVKYVGKQEFRFKIVDFDVGDVNGDGREELIVVAPHRVMVYTYRNKKFKQVAGFRAENENHEFLGVDVADINKNERDEIFITNQLGDSLSSFALEALPGKKGLQRTWKDINLYFRIIHPFGQKPTLLAQAPGFNDPFHGPIKKIVYKNGRYVNGSNLRLPSIYGMLFILYGLTSTDINGDGEDEVVILDKNYHLRVYSSSGRVLVQSDEYYGHDPRLINVSVKEDISGIADEGEPVRFRGRLEFFRQGRNRYLLLPRNYSAGGSMLPGLAALDVSGSIAVLDLNREGFKSSFETRRQKGYVAAYQMVKARGGQPTWLHMAAVEEKAQGGKTISTIYTYFWKNRK